MLLRRAARISCYRALTGSAASIVQIDISVQEPILDAFLPKGTETVFDELGVLDPEFRIP